MLSPLRTRLSNGLTGLGGLVTVVAFALPWASMNCQGELQVHTGVDLARQDPRMALILIAGACMAALGAWLFRRSRTPGAEIAEGKQLALHFFVLLLGLAALMVFLLKALEISRTRASLADWGQDFESIGVRVHLASFAALLGIFSGVVGSALGIFGRVQSEDEGPYFNSCASSRFFRQVLRIRHSPRRVAPPNR